MISGDKYFFKKAAVLSFFLFLLAAGCTVAIKERPAKKILRPHGPSSQFSLYLNGPDETDTDIRIKLSGIHLVSDDGTAREVVSGPLDIRSLNIRQRQLLLGEIYLPEGEFRALRIGILEASVITDDGKASLAIPSDDIDIPINIKTKNRENTTLFLSWDPDRSVSEGFFFSPAFSVSKEVPELSRLLIYVTNEDSDNVSVINRQSDRVVGTVMVGRSPRGVAAGSRDDRLRVYVANSGSNSISVINPNTNTVENEIHLRFGREPEGIAVVNDAAGKELIFVTCYSSNSVSVIDARSSRHIEQVNVGNGPVAVAADPPVESIFGSRFLSQNDISLLRTYREKFLNVYVANRESNTVSILRVDILNDRVEDVLDIDVGWSPVSLHVDYQRGRVYVANYDSDELSVIDIISIVDGDGAVDTSSIQNVGSSVIGVSANPVFDRVYLLKARSSEVLFINPYSEGADQFRSAISPVMASVYLGGAPRSVILDPEMRKLYVVNRGDDSISVINTTTKRLERTIPVAKNPYGIAMFSN
jgi:YVTN family beta-propeller protein